MELFKVESCRSQNGCPRAVMDTNKLKNIIEQYLHDIEFTKKRREQLGAGAKQHHIFKTCLSGCANGCSQPQIKDFALMAKAIPEFHQERCNLCGLCCAACKENGLIIKNDKLIFEESKCLGCGDCWRVCPEKAVKKGDEKWRLLVGGKLGRHPQLAHEIGSVSQEEILDYLKKAVDLILSSKSPHKRLADLLKDNPLPKRDITPID